MFLISQSETVQQRTYCRIWRPIINNQKAKIGGTIDSVEVICIDRVKDREEARGKRPVCRASRPYKLEFLAAFQGAGQCNIIRVFELGAPGQTAGQARHPDSERGNLLLKIQCGLLAFHVGICRQDDLGDSTA